MGASRADGSEHDLVRRLVASQFPRFADRALTPLPSGATDNAVYRLGSDLLVRLPRNADAAERIDTELRWLPQVSNRVSVHVPRVVGVGRPDLGFEHRWAVQRWIEGRDAAAEAPGDWPTAASSLARFVVELRAIEAARGPIPSAANAFRGAPLAALDEQVRWGVRVTAEMGSTTPFTAGVDVARVLEVWEEALAAPPWTGAPTWVHGDLLAGNVLLDHADGLAAVIDFGCLAVGDPACDLLPAWTVFRGRARAAFLTAAHLDDATHERARGWAVYVGITAAQYHHRTNPSFCALARRVLDDLLATA